MNPGPHIDYKTLQKANPEAARLAVLECLKTNGLCIYLRVISWLRSHGVTAEIVFTVDNSEEFGSKSWLKVNKQRKLIAGFGCRLIQNRKGHPEENAHSCSAS